MILWLRHQVFQLVLSQFIDNGKKLTQELIRNVSKKIMKAQNTEGQISFDRWLMVAKDLLKWNDYIIYLFWEMLVMATWYSKDNEISNNNNVEEEAVYVYHLIIFLSLHVDDTPNGPASTSTSSKSSKFDAFWPINMNLPAGEKEESINMPITTPSSRPTTPSKAHHPSSSMQQVPRSPKSSSTPTSPKKSSSAGAHVYSTPHPLRSASQHLFALKQKLPFILSLISSSENLHVSSRKSHSSPLSEYDNNYDSKQDSVTFNDQSLILKEAFDGLGLILCAGESKSKESFEKFSSFHSFWNNKVSNSSEYKSGYSSQKESLSYLEVLEWLNESMTINETIYPNISTSTASSSLMMNNSNSNISGKANSQCVIIAGSSGTADNTINTTSSYTPPVVYTSLSDKGSGTIGSVNNSPKTSSSSSSSIMNISSLSPRNMMHIDDIHPSAFNSPINSNLNNTNMYSSTTTDKNQPLKVRNKLSQYLSNSPTVIRCSSSTIIIIATECDEKHNINNESDTRNLPNIVISGCQNACLYILAPYLSATITNCNDCDIIIGSVAGSVSIVNCDNVKLTTTCRKLITHSSNDCHFNIASITPTVLAGDCKSLIFGPFNTNYKSLKVHMKICDLHKLLPKSYTEEKDAKYTADANNDSTSSANLWSSIHDMETCLDNPVTMSSPSGYALDVASAVAATSITTGASMSIPSPQSTVASLQSKDKFFPVIIPDEQENDEFKNCPIELQLQYKRHLHETMMKISKLRDKLLNKLNTLPSSSSSSSSIHKASISPTVASASMLSTMNLEGNNKQVHVHDNKDEPAVKSSPQQPLSSSLGAKKKFDFVISTNFEDADEKEVRRLDNESLQLLPESVSMSMSSLNPRLNKMFMDWLQSSDKTKELLELIRLDEDSSKLNKSPEIA